MNHSYNFLSIVFLIIFSLRGYSQSVPSYVPTNGLVGWWGFNGNAQDGSGNGNHGTVNGATLTTDRFGNQNGAYSFDGLNDDIQIASLANFDFQKKVSISVWINVNNYPGIKYNIVTKYGNNTDAFALDIAQNNLIFDLSTGWPNWFFYSSPFQWSVNNWYHIVSNYDFNGNKRNIYVNGQFHDSTNIIPAMINALSSNVVFGYFHNGQSIYNYQRYNGKLDDIGIWNRALTQQEITNLFNSQLPTHTSLCLPTITTITPTSIGIDSVVIGGDILNDGGSSIVLRGVCYSTTPNPNMGNPRTEEGSGIGSFTSTLRNLSPSTTYYARGYAKNSQGVVVYGDEVSFSTGTPIPGIRCPGTPSVTDIDGNLYNTVQIGTQCWTQSNLMVSKYRNGDSIPTGLSRLDWMNITSGAYAVYDNNPVNDSLYGKLYNHYAVMDIRGLCPTGWHVPTDCEWSGLVKFLEPNANTTGFPQSWTAGGMLKSTATQPTPGGWNAPNWGATNSSGFTGVPGGYRFRSLYQDYIELGDYGYWWTSHIALTSPPGVAGWARLLDFESGQIAQLQANRKDGLSVRCLKDPIDPILPTVTTMAVSDLSPNGAITGGEVILDGCAAVTVRGVAYGVATSPTVFDNATNDGSGAGSFVSTLIGLTPSTSYYVRAYATNSAGTAYGNEISFTTLTPPTPCPGTPTVADIDGNIYTAIQIGTQCWTQSNLKVSKYRNGDSIPTGLSDSAWGNTTIGAYAIYENNSFNGGLFGKLYNHYTVMDTRGLCPTGWHVPTDEEWSTMETFLGGRAVAGGALKSTATQPRPGGWPAPNTIATNSSGFSAGPGGLRGSNGVFLSVGSSGCWWSSSLSGANAWSRRLNRDDGPYRNSNNRTYGFSVRCLKDVMPTVTTTTVFGITATSAITGGDVIQDGAVVRGVAYGTSSSPTTSGAITNDGMGTGTFTSILTGLTPSTTYYVRAYATNSIGTAYGNELTFTTLAIPAFTCGTSTVSDVDGNNYNTVQIGTQCWTQSNLKVSKYRNGDNIPTGLSNTAWQNTTAGAYAIYNNNPVNDGLYGKLYNHYAVMDTRGLCPTGWHVPTDGEWTTLETFLGGSSVAGGALKSAATQPTPGGWFSPNTGATNSSGFSAGPGGLRTLNGAFNYVGYLGHWWSSSLSGTNAWDRSLYRDYGLMSRNYTNLRSNGFSVRCLRD